MARQGRTADSGAGSAALLRARPGSTARHPIGNPVGSLTADHLYQYDGCEKQPTHYDVANHTCDLALVLVLDLWGDSAIGR